MRHVLTPVALATAPLLVSAPSFASDLKLDGQTDLTASLGTTLEATLDGGAGLPATIAFDVSPGPVPLFGESVPLGLTSAFGVLADGATDPAGRFAVSVPLPSTPTLAGQTLYLAGVVFDPADTNGLDVSNGASLTFGPATIAAIETNLFGVELSGAPFFDWVTTVQQGVPSQVAIDPAAQPQLVGQTVDVWVVADRTADQWAADATLADLSGDGPDALVVSGAGLVSNILEVDTGLLATDNGPVFGIGYDVVVDVDRDGSLSAGDLVDGYLDGAGFYAVNDPTLPGPYTPVETIYSGGSFLGQNLFYPAEIDAIDQLHLVIVSHGNGHNYQWYDHLGTHLASWGYVVMSHENNTGPGVISASTTTLTNTEFFLANLDTIAGGVLEGKLIRDEITWIGHSRGGEGIVHAFVRLNENSYTSPEFDDTDIALLSSIAPTVFLNKFDTNPFDKPFSLWTGAGDSDVNGCANNNIAQTFQIFGRAEDQRQSICLYGVGHAWFHNGSGAFINGPCQIGRPRTHEIMRGYLLPMLEWQVRENPAARDFLWRQYEDLRPTRVETEEQNPCLVVNLQYTDAESEGKFVLDDMQNSDSEFLASSGIAISTDLTAWTKGRADDGDLAFTNDPADPFNAVTYARANDEERTATLWHQTTDQSLVYHLSAGTDDWSDYGWLAFRAGQSSRHPATVASLSEQQFSVRLVDLDGDSALLSTSSSLDGLEEPYQRGGCGSGIGWHSEYETIRFGLRGFQVVEPALDLDRLDRLEFLFGPNFGDPEGRLILDDVELHQN